MTWMQTYTGLKFDLQNPQPKDINIIDIAHALAYSNRFNGHGHFFYSIAQHSIHVSDLLPTKLRFQGLMHDAAETYVGDLIRPLKFPDFRALEHRILKTIFETFGVSWPVDPQVKDADLRILLNEARDVMGGQTFPWQIEGKPFPDLIIGHWDPKFAKEKFLEKFHDCVEREKYR